MKKINLFIAKKHGFCSGVDYAVNLLNEILISNRGEKKIFVYHSIVHNDVLIEEFEQKGVIFIESVKDAEEGSILIFSAHGVSAKVENEAKQRNITLYDATCDLVKKVHFLAKKYQDEGKEIVVIGKRNHQEMIGTCGRIHTDYQIVENENDVDKLVIKNPDNIGILTQTTLNTDYVNKIIQKIEIKFSTELRRKFGNICYATKERQDALKEIINHNLDFLFVIGSKTSSNSNELVKIGEKNGIKSFLIDSKKDIIRHKYVIDEMNKNVLNIGLTAGASAPEFIMNDIQKWLAQEYECIKH